MISFLAMLFVDFLSRSNIQFLNGWQCEFEALHIFWHMLMQKYHQLESQFK